MKRGQVVKGSKREYREKLRAMNPGLFGIRVKPEPNRGSRSDGKYRVAAIGKSGKRGKR